MDPKDLPRYVGEGYIQQFIREITPAKRDVSEETMQHCLEDGVPVLSEETRSLLGFLMMMRKPERVLEIGTAYGASALYMSSFLPEGGRIDTIERNPAMLGPAREHLAASRLLDRVIFLHEGHAQEVIPALQGPYQAVLMDASMGQYGLFWEEIQPLLAPGGWVLADNVLHGGMVAMDRLAIPRRQRTIHSRLRDFLKAVLEDERYQSALLPIGDGVLLAFRKEG